MNYRSIIIEDEVNARKAIKSYLRRYFVNIDVIAEIDNVKDAVDFLNKNKVDILFLDVHLKDGKSLALLNKINIDDFRIVFTTAHEDYALDAFKSRSFGYLLKPLDPLDFKEIMNRVLNDLSAKNESTEKKSIKVRIADGYRWIKMEEIIRFESESNYTKIFVVNEVRPITIAKTLKSIEKEFNPKNHFLRVNQSHIINVAFLSKTEIHNNSLILSNGHIIPVSRGYKTILEDYFAKVKL